MLEHTLKTLNFLNELLFGTIKKESWEEKNYCSKNYCINF